ncbi:alpha/beta hydrolase [Aquihabitans sp. G128]|uniref:alpha/beta fold hydrolase n=1 Tax=Aquihabitans sp. G128 TaxID=2849779 RepID=UPI001C24654F|nr:alpha/beta hydrolase [Aquihabitans sp. G128]QXC61645.1 alpha/beta hydrolase [Aquihabitans sp. G128]
MSNVPAEPRTAIPEAAATDLTRRFAVDGVELAWDRWGAGSGTELVLCHGYSGTAHDFALHVERLAADRPVLALDHRGHGRSTKLGRADGYAIDRLAADLVAFVEATASGPVDLLGHSMGGRIALLATLARPDLVRSLVLMDTSPWSFRAEDAGIAALVDAFLAAFDPTQGLPDPTLMAGPEDALIADTTPAWWQARKVELWGTFDPYALKALGEELFRADAPSLRDRLGELALPVTVLVGAQDHPYVDQAPAVAAEVPDGELVVVEGAFHSPQLTHQQAWADAVDAHLARAAGAGLAP